MADVKLNIKLRVFDPVGISQAIGHPDQAPSEYFGAIQAAAIELKDIGKAQAASRNLGLVIDAQAANMHRRIFGVQMQEQGV